MNLTAIADKINNQREREYNYQAKVVAENLAQSEYFKNALIKAANTGLYALILMEVASEIPRHIIEAPSFQRTLNKYLKSYGAKIKGYRISWD